MRTGWLKFNCRTTPGIKDANDGLVKNVLPRPLQYLNYGSKVL